MKELAVLLLAVGLQAFEVAEGIAQVAVGMQERRRQVVAFGDTQTDLRLVLKDPLCTHPC